MRVGVREDFSGCASGRYVARRGAFTLMEVGLSILIVGVGVMALMELLATGTIASRSAYDRTTATNLADNIREYLALKTATQALALNGSSYSPPVDATGTNLSGLSGWSQAISVVPTDPDNCETPLPGNTTSGIVRATITVSFNSAQVSQVSWLITEAP
jgi:hypothetical protein